MGHNNQFKAKKSLAKSLQRSAGKPMKPHVEECPTIIRNW